ncbi:MAG: MCE family protein [Actinomycetota bacterium]|nr:MCE family protein [Actinomycetota bacterium]
MSRLAKTITSTITALCMVGLLVVGWIQFQGDDDNYEITAYFEKAIGLFKNSDVTQLGVAIGKVTEVDPQGRTVRIEMVVDSKYKIPADTQAEIVPISVISDRYIELDTYQGGPALPDGATIDASRTVIPAELDDVFKQLKKLLDALRPEGEGELGSLGELIVALDKALEGREQDLKGTLINGAQLTQTLARARDDISGLLTNLDGLFRKLAPRADSIATLNRNFAVVMRFLASNRDDLTGTLSKLGDVTDELSDLVKDNSSTLSSVLTKAARITPIILKNQESIEESLAWLGVVGEGLRNAYHAGEIRAVDVRSNRNTAALCEDFDDFPIDPDDFPPPLDDIIRDLLEQLEKEICPNPGEAGAPQPAPSGPRGSAPPLSPDIVPEIELNCDRGVREVKRQIRRIEDIGIPQDAKDELLKPLKENLEELAEKCRELGDTLDDPDALDDLLDGLPDQLVDQLLDELNAPEVDALTGTGLSGSAAGGAIVPPPSPSFGERVGSWAGGLLNFLGVS